MSGNGAPADKNVERASKLDTATISDALDSFGLNGQCYKIKPRDHTFRMTGRAYAALHGCGQPPRHGRDYVDDIPPGKRALVLDNAGRDPARSGRHPTEVAHRRGIAVQ